MTNDDIKRLAEEIAKNIVATEYVPHDQCQRIALKGGRYPDKETDLGGLCISALVQNVASTLRLQVAPKPLPEIGELAKMLWVAIDESLKQSGYHDGLKMEDYEDGYITKVYGNAAQTFTASLSTSLRRNEWACECCGKPIQEAK